MAAKKPAFEFVVAQLEKNANAVYADVRAAAEKRGYTIYPIMYGRAKRLLGLVDGKKGKGGAKKAAKKAAKTTRTVRKAAPKPAKKVARKTRAAASAPAAGAVAGLEGVIEAMRSNEADRERFHGALVRIREILDEVL